MQNTPLTTFSKVEYVRPDFEAAHRFYEDLNARLRASKSYAEVKACILEEEEYSSHINTMATVVEIRHTVDTSDEFYAQEEEYIRRNLTELMAQMQGFNLALLDSPFKADIDKEYGTQFLKAVKLGADSFCEKNIPLMQEENELTNRYQKLTAACKISFDGGEHNLYGILKYFSDPDRETRKQAAAKYADKLIITSDNPRDEIPEAIIDDILAGLEGSEIAFDVVVDRRKAIHHSLKIAQEGDVIVLAGKGHEDYQVLPGNEHIHFDEREIVSEGLKLID